MFAKAKKFPQQQPKRFGVHFNYIIEEFSRIDCEFFDDDLRKLLLELKEINLFNQWLKDFLSKDELSKVIKDIKKTPALYNEVIKRLKYAYKRNVLLMQHYSGEIDAYIWRKAKASKEIVSYLKKHMPRLIPNSSEFLLHKEKISPVEYKTNYKLDKQNIIVISNNLTMLETFKEITDAPFDNWNFYAFAQLNMLDAWLRTNSPHMIIIDYNFKTSVINNGLQFLRVTRKKNPLLEEIIKNQRVCIIAKDLHVVEMQKNRCDIKYTIINDKLILKNISQSIIYS